MLVSDKNPAWLFLGKLKLKPKLFLIRETGWGRFQQAAYFVKWGGLTPM